MKPVLFALTLVLAGQIALAQELTVFAASSLTEAFEEIVAAFEAQNEGVDVLLNFDGSSTLALQITQGAPADVFASANEAQMQRVVKEGLAQMPQTFAGNRLVVIVPEDVEINSLEELANEARLIVLAAPEVPVGKYAR